MSIIGNNIFRSTLTRQLCAALRQNFNANQITPPKLSYTTVVSTSKNVFDISSTGRKEKLSNAAKVFLDRAKEYDEMMQEARNDYQIGMRHLANMMGADPDTFTQADADAAIEYLFPSGIFDKKAHPTMKPPEEVFPPRKKPQFDKTGRPFHTLFFTSFPHFYDLCHETIGHMKALDAFEDQENRNGREPNPDLKLEVGNSSWLNKEQLETLIIEQITDKHHEDFVTMMNRLLAHPYSYRCKDFIMQYRQIMTEQRKGWEVIEPKVGEDGRSYVTTYECRRKSAIADVTVISPGTGSITVNGKDISYFANVQSREQVSN